MPYKDPEKRKASEKANTKRWREDNKERWLAYQRDWNARNNDRINERRRWRHHNDPEYRARADALLRVRRWKILPEEKKEFLAMYEECCFYCGGVGGTIDHLTPRSLGGADRLYNLVPCCKSCNSSKNNRTPGEWYSAGGFTIR